METYSSLEGYGNLAELIALANEIKSKLIEQYTQKNGAFIDQDNVREEGLITQCAGGVSLLLLANGFPELELGQAGKDIVLREFRKVASYVKDAGYDATPFINKDRTAQYFNRDAFDYTDSLTWVLSFMLHLRLADRTKRINLDDEDLNTVKEAVKESLTKICEAACPQGGWGFASGCKEPDLYYSYAVSEALADFADYILGETKGIIDEDTMFIEYLGPELIKTVDQQREKTAGWLIENYCDQLGTGLLNPYNETFNPQEVKHRLLYYTYFVIDMLIVLSAGEKFFTEQKDKILKAIEHGIYLSRIALDKAKDDRDWWIDPKLSSLKLHWKNHPKINGPQVMGKVELYEPGLVPLSMRCNALYAYYIARGEDKKMLDLYDDLIKNRHQATGLWDTTDYTLMVTERAIEALVDYTDYVREFQAESQPPPEIRTSRVEEMFQSMVRDAVNDYLTSPEAAQLLPVPAKSAEPYNSASSEREMLTSMKSAFVAGQQFLLDRNSPNMDTKLVKSFCDQFGEFLSSLFYHRLKGTLGDEFKEQFKQDKIGLIEDKQQELFTWMATRFASDISPHPGDVLTWLVEFYQSKARS